MACNPYWNDTVLACTFDGTNGSTSLVDLKGHTITAYGNAQLTTSSPLSGTASLLLDGDGDYASIATGDATDFNFGTGDFFIECDVMLNAMPSSDSWPGSWSSHMVVVGKGVPSGSPGYDIVLGATNIMWNRNDPAVASAAHGMTTGVKYRLGACRASGVLRLAINGVVKSSVADTTDYTYSSPFFIGSETGEGAWFNGKIDNLVVGKQVLFTGDYTPVSTLLTNQCTISGTVKNSSAASVSRLVRAYRRDTGVLVGSALSNGTTGAYSFPVRHSGECYVVRVDDTTDPPTAGTENALIYDRVLPA